MGGKTYKVELVEVDNQSDTSKAVTAAQSLVSSGVSVVLGSYGSGVSIAAGEIFREAKIPAIGVSCTNPQVTLGNDYYFRICFLDPFQGTVMASFAQSKGAKKAFVITQLGDDYSTGLGNYFKSAFEAAGGAVVTGEFQTGEVDFNAILTNAKNENVDVIFAPSSIATAPLIIQQARQLGITCPIIGEGAWASGDFLTQAGDAAEGIYGMVEYLPDIDTELNPMFTQLYGEITNGKSPDKYAACDFNAVLVMANAIDKAGSTDAAAIRDALRETDMTIVTGNIKFDAKGQGYGFETFLSKNENGTAICAGSAIVSTN